MRMPFAKSIREGIREFSWAEFLMVFAGGSLIAALPGILYGADRSMLFDYYTVWYFVYWIVFAIIFCFVTANLKYRIYERPLCKLSKAASQVAGGDFSVYLDAEHGFGKLEYLDTLFDDFNKMVAELGSIETLKSDFVSNMSHEIKTPLAVIKNYSAVLKQEDLPKETRDEYMDTIIAATDSLASLVTNILKLNKLENQEIEPRAEAYDLCRQLCDCTLRFESLWEKKNIELEVDIEDQLMIAADSGMMEIVWNNLLSNTIKFCEPGGKVSIRQTSDANSVFVSVSDTGCGMDEETQRRVFDKFYQGTTSQKKDGNGLGLALAARVVDRLNGTLSVKSELGRGSVFTVQLDLTDREGW